MNEHITKTRKLSNFELRRGTIFKFNNITIVSDVYGLNEKQVFAMFEKMATNKKQIEDLNKNFRKAYLKKIIPNMILVDDVNIMFTSSYDDMNCPDTELNIYEIDTKYKKWHNADIRFNDYYNDEEKKIYDNIKNVKIILLNNI